MPTIEFGTYMATLPWVGKGENPNPGATYSLLYNDDTESGLPAFHEPNDMEFWGREYSPTSYELCVVSPGPGYTGPTIAGAESGPSLAAELPPGIRLVPKRPR